MPEQQPHAIAEELAHNLSQVIRGQEHTIRNLLAGFAAGAHILLEDVPGTGKTTLAKALALSIRAQFKRVQFTPDLLPSDVIGISIFDQNAATFKLYKGPIFTNILLVDEINRTSPRTQSALLEAMAEKQVSIDGTGHALEELFFVIATQNPVESHGTYPLPEAQMDRFGMQLSLGYIDLEQEVLVLQDQDREHPITSVQPVATIDDILTLRRAVIDVRISNALQRYIVTLVQATRNCEGVALGASPRASLMLAKVAKAIAFLAGRNFVIPEDIQDVANAVLAHRLILDPQAQFSGRTQQQIVEEVLHQVTVPV